MNEQKHSYAAQSSTIFILESAELTNLGLNKTNDKFLSLSFFIFLIQKCSSKKLSKRDKMFLGLSSVKTD